MSRVTQWLALPIKDQLQNFHPHLIKMKHYRNKMIVYRVPNTVFKPSTSRIRPFSANIEVVAYWKIISARLPYSHLNACYHRIKAQFFNISSQSHPPSNRIASPISPPTQTAEERSLAAAFLVTYSRNIGEKMARSWTNKIKLFLIICSLNFRRKYRLEKYKTCLLTVNSVSSEMADIKAQSSIKKKIYSMFEDIDNKNTAMIFERSYTWYNTGYKHKACSYISDHSIELLQRNSLLYTAS